MSAAILKSLKALLAAKIVASFVLGYAGAYAMPPWGYWFMLFPALSGFYILTGTSASARQALVLGWFFGLGYYIAGLSWVGNAFKVEGNPFSWVLPIAVAGLPMMLSCFSALAGMLARRFYALNKVTGFLGFTGILATGEWLRGHVFTGFPWNLYGHAWAEMLPVVQIVYYTDVYFLTLLTVFWMTLPGFLFLGKDAGRRTKSALVLIAALSFAVCHGLGNARLNANPTEFHEDVSVQIVQPNIAQSDKWQRDKMVSIFYRHVDLSRTVDAGAGDGTTYVVWPETALSQWFAQDRSSMKAIADALASHQGKAYLLTGLLRKAPESDRYLNSIALINDKGEISNLYDKSHLVPFGEYVPFQKWIPLEPVVRFSGFLPGGGVKSFTTPEGLSYSPLVCYEVIFSGKVVERGTRPDFIVNVTNDGWYGRSAGPHQHFTQAVFRAVEEGVPVVRSANTGVSGLADAYGRVLYRSELFEESAKTFRLPKKIATPAKSPYFESIILWGLLLSLMAVGAIYKK